MPITHLEDADDGSTDPAAEASIPRDEAVTDGARRRQTLYGELLADKHPEESVDGYVERLASAARTEGRTLGPDGPLRPSPRTSDRVSAPSEYVTGASDADWHYPTEDDA